MMNQDSHMLTHVLRVINGMCLLPWVIGESVWCVIDKQSSLLAARRKPVVDLCHMISR